MERQGHRVGMVIIVCGWSRRTRTYCHGFGTERAYAIVADVGSNRSGWSTVLLKRVSSVRKS